MSICEKHIWPAFKVVLSAGTPIQKLFDRGGETHLFLNSQALKILINDDRIDACRIIERYRSILDTGNLWADKGWKCFAHYYRPDNGKGFIPWISAVTEGLNFFNASLYKWRKGMYQESMFYLGAATHIVQDVCVPHHAMGIAFNGHRKFELWALENKGCFKLERGNSYDKFKCISELIRNNANISKNFYYDVSDDYTPNYASAGRELLFLAQRTTANIFDLFTKIISS